MFEKKEEHPNLKRIRENFYTGIAEYALNDPNLSKDNIDDKIKKHYVPDVIQSIINRSANLDADDAIRLLDDSLIHDDNCPPMYKPLLNAILALRKNNSDEQIQNMARQIVLTPAFQIIISTVKRNIFEILGFQAVQGLSLDESNISAELIRDTFYNEMVNQTCLAVNSGLISRDDLESYESYIHFALPALTLLEAIQSSKDCNGIKLLGDKVVHAQNCPNVDELPRLISELLKCKETLKTNYGDKLEIPEQDIQYIQSLILAKDMEQPAKRPEKPVLTIGPVGLINHMSLIISEQKSFHQMIPMVIQAALEATASENVMKF